MLRARAGSLSAHVDADGRRVSRCRAEHDVNECVGSVDKRLVEGIRRKVIATRGSVHGMHRCSCLGSEPDTKTRRNTPYEAEDSISVVASVHTCRDMFRLNWYAPYWKQYWSYFAAITATSYAYHAQLDPLGRSELPRF